MDFTKELENAIVVPGPVGFHPPSAAELGVLPPDPRKGLSFGHVVEEEKVLESRVHDGKTHTNPLDFGMSVDPVSGNAAAFGHKAEHMKSEA